jgi:hypothetical protein
MRLSPSLINPFRLLRKRRLSLVVQRLEREIEQLREELVTHPIEIAELRIQRDNVRQELAKLEASIT